MVVHSVKRSGLIGIKLGMTRIFDAVGNEVPVTLIAVQENKVVAHKTATRDGYNALVLGQGVAASHRVKKPRRGMCAKANIEPVQNMKEFDISDNCFVDVGSHIGVEHFVVGQYLDISAVSIGKGFAGAMKRWNFSGLEASHGVSISHRAHGSTGQRQDPGKVFKNKKMAGHMGHTKITTQNLQVVDIDPEMCIIAVRGAVPGSKQSLVYLRDAIKKAVPVSAPFPAYVAKKAGQSSAHTEAAAPRQVEQEVVAEAIENADKAEAEV